MGCLTSVILLRFVNDFCELYRNEKSIYRTSLSLLCEQYTLYILPMLNPDGVDYQINGITEENPFYNRVLNMNGGKKDLSHWQANARGVDLNHNYDAGFWEYKEMEFKQNILGGAPSKFSGEYPESEPEVGHLCNFIRFHERLRMVLTLHTQGKEIFYQSQGKSPLVSHMIARRISALTGYRITEPVGSAAYGGLTDWCIEKCALPTFTVECGKGVNPLPLQYFFPIYASLREVLFTIPKMI
jgi:g-D-glutamyl-meso-diaminopimelate peptidase